MEVTEVAPLVQTQAFLGGLWGAAFTTLFAVFTYVVKSTYERRMQTRIAHVYLEHTGARFINLIRDNVIEAQGLLARLPAGPTAYFPNLASKEFNEDILLKPLRRAFGTDVFDFEMMVRDANSLTASTLEVFTFMKDCTISQTPLPGDFIRTYEGSLKKYVEHLKKIDSDAIKFCAKARVLAKITTKWKMLPLNPLLTWPFYWSSTNYTEKEKVLFLVEERDISI